MPIEDLKSAGLLLPEEEWGKYSLKTTVNKAELLVVGILGIISTFLMYLGDGNWLTISGIILFLFSLLGFTIISIIGIEKQHRKIYSDRK